MNKIIKSRQILSVYWTTDADVVSHAESADRKIEKLLAGAPDFFGTPRQVLSYLKDVAQDTGNVYRCTWVRDAAGKYVSIDDVRLCVADADSRKG